MVGKTVRIDCIKEITKEPKPCAANFEIEHHHDTPNLFTFHSQVNDDIVDYYWEFGDGRTAREPSPTHEFEYNSDYKDYTVCLTIASATGCESRICKKIEIFPNDTFDCYADFSYEVMESEPPHFVFHDKSKGDIVYRKWNFDDGNISSNENPVHSFYTNEKETYNVCLSITSSNGCESTKCKPVTPDTNQDPCYTDFEFHKLPNEPFTYQFFQKTGGDVAEYHWDFGFMTSNEPDPVVSFLESPFSTPWITVCLKTKTADGCVSSECKRINIHDDTECQVRFEYETYDSYPAIPLLGFKAVSNKDILHWHWTFGDGSESYDPQPVHSFDFSDNKSYNVCLSVITIDSCEAHYCQKVPFNQNPDCQVKFNYNVMESYPPQYAFEAISDNEIVEYHWSFGDGAESVEPKPVHIYDLTNLQRSYDVCLKAVMADGCTAHYCEQVQTYYNEPDCQTKFYYYINDSIRTFAPTNQIPITFVPISEQPLAEIVWEFEDNEASTDFSPTHFFDRTIDYTQVCLITTTEDGCTSTYCEDILINRDTLQPPPCDVYFHHDISVADCINCYDFFGISDNDVKEWYWKFGDGTFSHEQNPMHAFPYEGTFNVCLHIKTETGCFNTYCDKIVIGNDTTWGSGECQVDFDYEISQYPPLSYPHAMVHFEPFSSNEIVKWEWSFGNGKYSRERNPKHIYRLDNITSDSDVNAVFDVCLTATTVNGCQTSICKTIELHPWSYPDECKADFMYFPANLDETSNNSAPVFPYRFVDASKGDVVERIWEYRSPEKHIVTSYDEMPVFDIDFMHPEAEVCLTIETSNGCKSTICKAIMQDCGTCYDDKQEPGFGFYNLFEEYGTFLFYNNVFSSNINWNWNFGDGDISFDQNTIHEFAEPGIYNVCLWFSVNNVDTLSVCDYVMVGAGKDTVRLDKEDGAGPWSYQKDGSKVHFNYQTFKSGNGVTCLWDFGDGNTATGAEVSHEYAQTGVYTVSLTVVEGENLVTYSRDIAISSMSTQIDIEESFTEVNLYPNPANEILNIEIYKANFNELTIEIYNATGKQILKKKIEQIHNSENITLNISDLKSGLYIVNIKPEGKTPKTLRFTKIN